MDLITKYTDDCIQGAEQAWMQMVHNCKLTYDDWMVQFLCDEFY